MVAGRSAAWRVARSRSGRRRGHAVLSETEKAREDLETCRSHPARCKVKAAILNAWCAATVWRAKRYWLKIQIMIRKTDGSQV